MNNLNLKQLILALLVFMSMAVSMVPAHAAEADEGESLNLYTKSSTEVFVYPINELRKITFSKKGVQIWNTNWPTEYSYSQFHVITMNNNKGATGIEILPAGSGDADGTAYYDLQGRRVGSPKQGIYIVRMSNGTTRKVIFK